MQVVLLHMASAFLPGLAYLRPELAHFEWEVPVAATPLFFLLNGYSAVSVFFLLSGAALACSFAANPRAVTSSLARRVVRLGIPMAAAVLFGAALIAAFPGWNQRAVQHIGSHMFLPEAYAHPVKLLDMLHQIGVEGLLTGFNGLGIWPGFVTRSLGVSDCDDAISPALWTLHVELVGSVIVLLLVALRAMAPRRLHNIVCAMVCALLLTSPFLPFVIGYLAAPWLRARRPSGTAHMVAGLTLLAVGVAACGVSPWLISARVWRALPGTPFGWQPDQLQFQYMVGATLVFFGVAMLPALQTMLATRPLRWLGQISFGLYLVHLPLLLTVGSWLFVTARAHMSYGAAIAVALTAYGGLSLLVARFFTRWVDRPAIRLSRRMATPGGPIGKHVDPLTAR